MGLMIGSPVRKLFRLETRNNNCWYTCTYVTNSILCLTFFCSNTHEIWQETFSGIKSGDLRMFVSVDRYNLTQSNMSPFYTIFLVCIATNAVLAHYYGHDHGEDQHTIPHYHFEYGVHDPHTHDVKAQHEGREHDHVQGGYTLKEADGTQRVVEYVAGPHSGFQAVVRRIGHAQHPAHYGKHGYGGIGGTSYVGVTHWGHGSGR